MFKEYSALKVMVDRMQNTTPKSQGLSFPCIIIYTAERNETPMSHQVICTVSF